MRSHLARGAGALALAFLVGAVVPVGRDRLGGAVPAAGTLSVKAGDQAAGGARPANAAARHIDFSGSGLDRDRSIARRPVPSAVGELSGYVWPLPKGRLTQPFGFSPFGTLHVMGRPFHDGLDIATFCGDRVGAAHAGTVLAAGRHSDSHLGWIGSLDAYHRRLDSKHLWGGLAIIVVVDDGNGYRSIYAHLSRALVRPGDTVRAGQVIGYEGATGFAFGCHLHYGLFSPLETETMELDPKIVRKTRLPAFELARIDPLLVLPPRGREGPQSLGASSNAPSRPVTSTSSPGRRVSGAT